MLGKRGQSVSTPIRDTTDGVVIATDMKRGPNLAAIELQNIN